MYSFLLEPVTFLGRDSRNGLEGVPLRDFEIREQELFRISGYSPEKESPVRSFGTSPTPRDSQETNPLESLGFRVTTLMSRLPMSPERPLVLTEKGRHRRSSRPTTFF